MTPIRFCTVPLGRVQEWTRADPLPDNILRDYLAVRPGIFDDVDIFCPNCRSREQVWQDFSLFHRLDHYEPGCVVVLPTILELFLQPEREREAQIAIVIQKMQEEYPKAGAFVIQFNHDADCATVPAYQGLPPRFVVMQFNTSNPSPNDVLLPFWTINTDPPREPKRFEAGFIGYVGGIEVRRQLVKAFRGRAGYDVHSSAEGRLPEFEYLKRLSACRFAFCPRGHGLGSYRTYEAIHCGSIPIIFADAAKLPYPDLDWSEFSIRVPEYAADDVPWLESIMRSFDYERGVKRLEEVRPRFSLKGCQEAVYAKLREVLTSPVAELADRQGVVA